MVDKAMVLIVADDKTTATQATVIRIWICCLSWTWFGCLLLSVSSVARFTQKLLFFLTIVVLDVVVIGLSSL